MNGNVKQVPLYEEICRQLQDKIEKGVYPKGSLMPSESEIQAHYGVSRVTARRAYKVLIDQGILRTVKGKGTFVNDLDSQDWTWMRSFTREVLQSGRVPSTKIVSFRVVKVDDEVAGYLQIPPRTECYYLKRVRYIDNKPVWLTKTYIPVTKAEGLEKEYFSEKGSAQSIFFVLEKDFGLSMVFAEEWSVAAQITERDAPLLCLDIHKPVISTACIFKDSMGKPVVHERTIFEQSISKKETHRLG